MKSLRHGTPLYHLGVDLDRLDARLVRVADGRLADGVVAAARAEHLFVVSLRSLGSSRRGGVLRLLVRRHCSLCVSEVRDVAASRCSESSDRCGSYALQLTSYAARVVAHARFHYLLEVNAAEDKFMHGSFDGRRRRRRTPLGRINRNERLIEIQLAVRHSKQVSSPADFAICDRRAISGSTGRRTWFLAALLGPRSRREPKRRRRRRVSCDCLNPSEIATRACTACADQEKIPTTSSRTRSN